MKKLNKDTIKKRITTEREKRGWTQAELAKKARITPAAICQIEKGDRTPTIPVLHRIAQVLQVSLDYLAGYKDSVEQEDVQKNSELKVFFRKYRKLDQKDKEFIETYIHTISKTKEKK